MPGRITLRRGQRNRLRALTSSESRRERGWLRTITTVVAAVAVLVAAAVPASAGALSVRTSVTLTSAAPGPLYDQYNNAGPSYIPSQDFEPSHEVYDAEAADDFAVPAGERWTVSSIEVDGSYGPWTGSPDSVNVAFYANAAGNLPGASVASRPGNSYLGGSPPGDLAITLTSAVVLNPGIYWVSVQTRQDINTDGQWYWTYRSVVSNNGAAWRNPNNGWGGGCTTWTRVTCHSGVLSDLVFRLIGTAAPLPTVTAVSPAAGPTGGGQTVTIIGTRFTGANWVSFGGTLAPSFTVVNANKITAVSPARAASVINIQVNTPLGTSAVVPADQYSYQGPPTVTGVKPVAGPPRGGTTVTILGTNFRGATWVAFSGVAARSFTVVSARQIIAVTPSHAAGSTNVRVTTPVGQSPVVAAGQYTFQGLATITAVTPNNGPAAGGQTVIIAGSNFTGTSWVSFSGVAAPTFTVNSPTQITVVTPAHTAGGSHVRVNTPLGVSPIVPADHYTFN